MRHLLLILTLPLSLLTCPDAPQQIGDGCVTNGFMQGNRYVLCVTCCYAGSCTTTCS